jgi:hypothetical protein
MLNLLAATCVIVYSGGADGNWQEKRDHEIAHCNGWVHPLQDAPMFGGKGLLSRLQKYGSSICRQDSSSTTSRSPRPSNCATGITPASDSSKEKRPCLTQATLDFRSPASCQQQSRLGANT